MSTSWSSLSDRRVSAHGWSDYQWWTGDRKVLVRLNRLIEEAGRMPGEGIAKPERLKGDPSDHWSRRIDQEHRLVYAVDGDTITVVQCCYHY